jgi:RNA polymerase sigma factor for flagellar operon FliA
MEPIIRTPYEQPEEMMEKEELKSILIEVLESLTEKERRVIQLYYYDELNLKEISLVLEVSESRVSQLHTKALQKMKMKIGNQAGYIFGI